MPTHPWQVNKRRASPGVGYVEFSGNSADGEQLSIGGRIYEFDTSVGGVEGVDYTAGTVRVDVNGGVTAANSITALVAAINGDASRTVDALDIGGNVCALVHRTPGAAGNLALTEPVPMANGQLSAALMTQGADEALGTVQFDQYAFTAADVTTMGRTLGTSEIIVNAFPSTSEPRLVGATLRTAAGVVKSLTDISLRIAQVNANQWGLFVADAAAGATIVAGDILTIALARGSV